MSQSEARDSRWKWQRAWALVFALNLILPMLFVYGGRRDGNIGDYAGIVIALLILWAAGAGAVAASRALRFALLSGGVLTGLALGIPASGVYLWMLTLQVASRVVAFAEQGPPTHIEAFQATLVTGGLIAATALVVGLLLYGLWRLRG